MLIVVGCNPVKKEEKNATKKSEEIGEYIYKETGGCVHIDRKCYKILILDDGSGIHPIKTYDITHKDIQYICPDCVSDENFEKLSRVCADNEERYE